MTGSEVVGPEARSPSETVDPHADHVAAVAVAGGGQVQRAAGGPGDVDAAQRPLVGGGERVALVVVAGDGRRQRLAGGRARRSDRHRVDDRRRVTPPPVTVQVKRVRVRRTSPSDDRDRDGVRARRAGRQRAADHAGGGVDRGAVRAARWRCRSGVSAASASWRRRRGSTTAPSASVRSPRSVENTGAELATVTGSEVVGPEARSPSETVDPHADQVAAVAVAGGGQVQRAAGGAGDVDAVARPLVGGGERVAVGVVAGDGRRQRLRRWSGPAGAMVTESTTGAVFAVASTVQVKRVGVAARRRRRP